MLCIMGHLPNPQPPPTHTRIYIKKGEREGGCGMCECMISTCSSIKFYDYRRRYCHIVETVKTVGT